MDTRGVKNRDLVTLARVRCLMAEVQALEEREAWQRERMTRITQQLGGTGRGGGAGRGLDEAVAALDSLERSHAEKIKAYCEAVAQAEWILKGIESAEARAIVRLKYLNGEPDARVREKLGMTRYRYDSAKRAIENAPGCWEIQWRDRVET